jgi:hypothetical protein
MTRGTVVALSWVALMGCGGTSAGRADASPPTACEPGAPAACTCAAGNPGLEACLPDGSGFGACAHCQPLTLAFRVAPSYPVGIAPYQLVTGDLDGDGRGDLVVGDNGNNGDGAGVHVLRRRADGGYESSAFFPGAAEAELADVTGDGVLDLLEIGGGVALRAGHGDGSFAAVSVAVAAGPSVGVAVGHLDGDDHADLVVTRGNGGVVDVFLGSAAGTFVAPVTYSVGDYAAGVAIGDVSGDGLADLVVVGATSADVSVLLGAGDGSFGAPSGYALGGAPWKVTLADLSGDGVLDIAVGDSSVGTHVLINDGHGAFAAPVVYPSSGQGPAAADLDGDGDVDLALANGNDVVVLRNPGDGALVVERRYLAGAYPGAIAATDLDGDGRIDLAVGNLWDGTVTVLHGGSDGSFAAAPFDGGAAAQRDVALGDLDGDGFADLVLALEGQSTVTVRRGGADGRFGAPTEVPAGARQWPHLVVADLDGDRFPDVIVSRAGGVSVLLGRGDASFAPAVNYSMGQESSLIATADLDGDGDLDLVAGPVTAEGGPYDVAVWKGRGDGTFADRRDVRVGYGPEGLALGDLDGDGRPDLAVGFLPEGSRAALLHNLGDGSFAPMDSALGYALDVAIQDLDADGANDLILASNVTGSQVLATARGHGDGTFEPPRSYLAPYWSGPMVFGDLDGDLEPDLVLANGRQAAIYRVRAGVLQDPLLLTAGDGAAESALGDVDGDGLLDVVVGARTGVATLVNDSRR